MRIITSELVGRLGRLLSTAGNVPWTLIRNAASAEAARLRHKQWRSKVRLGRSKTFKICSPSPLPLQGAGTLRRVTLSLLALAFLAATIVVGPSVRARQETQKPFMSASLNSEAGLDFRQKLLSAQEFF